MKRILFHVIGVAVIVLISGLNIIARDIKITGDGKTSVTLISQSKSELEIQVKVNGYQLFEQSTTNGKAFTIGLTDGSPILEAGAPDLFKLAQSIIIPDDESYMAEVVNSDFIELDQIDVAPSKGNLYRNQDPAQIPWSYGNTYQSDSYYPGKMVQMRDPYILRDYRGQTVIINPLQYNPIQKKLRIYTQMTIRLKPTGEKGINVFTNHPKSVINDEFNEIYKRQFINYASTKYTPVAESGKMLIICPAQYFDEMQPFIEWKIQRGQEVEIVEFSSSTTGTTATALKTYITNYYNTNANSFLLLVGDAEDIPSLSQSGDSDVAYSYISGNDSYPEFFVGRFSAQNSADVTTQVNRSIYYERDMPTSASWLSTGIGIASAEGGGSQGDDGEADKVHITNIKNDLIGYTYTQITDIYDPGASATQVANAVNPGCGIINYCGHGSDTYWGTTGFSVTNCGNLTNENKLPFIFDVACVNGNFHGQTCFAEAWLRASHNNNPTGAIAMVAATINQSWNPPMDGQDEMDDILVETYSSNIKRTFGGIVYNGCLHMNDEYGADGDEMTDTWTTFGDPSVLVRTAAPTTMAITHEQVLFIGMSNFNVDCDLDGAVACLSAGNQIVGKAIVSNGVANITFSPFTDVTTCNLVVTGYNKVTYTSQISVLPAEGPYISLQSYSIGDNTGNNNGLADYDENVTLNFTIKNVGVEATSNLQAVLSSSDNHITITNNTYNYGSISAGQILSGSVFQATLAYNIPDQYGIPLVITFTDNQNNLWEKSILLPVSAPKIELSQISVIEDGSWGDGNGRIDPDESGYITVQLKNAGHSAADQIALNFALSNPYVTIESSSAQVSDLAIDGIESVMFKVTANSATPEGTQVAVTFAATANESVSLDGTFIVGQLPELQIGDGTTAKAEFPFYNYYENNKSQMLYFASEFPSGTQILTDLAFDLATATQNAQHRDLANFSIKLGTTPEAQMPVAYVTLDNPVTVFAENPYLLPANTGLCNFDIDDYTYDPSAGNLVIEISWGDNGEYCGSTDKTSVNCTTTNVNTVSFGFNDSQTPPSFNSNSTSRPNVLFKFLSQGSDVENVTLHVTASGSNNPLANAQISIGSVVTNSDANGNFTLDLAHGTYPVKVKKFLYFDYSGTITVDATHTTFNLAMLPLGPTHYVQVTINENDQPLSGVDVSFAGSTLLTQVSGTVTFNYIPEGTWQYDGAKEGYYDISGEIVVDGDEIISLDMEKIPTFNIQFIVEEGESPIADALVSFNNGYIQTNDEGTASFENVRINQDLIYKVTKTGYFALEGSIDATKDTIIHLQLQHIPDLTVKVQGQYGIVTGAKVEFQSLAINTDDSGDALFTDVEIGTEQVVSVSKSGYYTSTDTVDIQGDDIVVDIYLRKKTDLTCIVTHNDVPLKSAKITLGKTNKYTDVNGKASFTSLASAIDVPVKVTSSNMIAFYDTIDITYDDDTLLIAMKSMPNVSFKVMAGDSLLANSSVTFNNVTQFTDEEGITSFASINPGNYSYTVSKTSYLPVEETLELNENDTLVTVNLYQIPDLKVVVMDGDVPMENATIIMNDYQVKSNSEGLAILEDIGLGEFIFDVEMEGYSTLSDTVTISEFADYIDTVYMQRIYIQVAFEINFNASAAEGVSVTINNETKTTQSDGKVSFIIPYGTNYPFEVSKTGYEVVKDTFQTVFEDFTHVIDLNILVYNVTFEVTDGTNAIPEAIINLNDLELSTDEFGKAVFSQVPYGTFLNYTISKEGYLPLEKSGNAIEDDVNETVVLILNSNPDNSTYLISLYPNPNNGRFVINSNQNNGTLKIYDSNGKLVNTQPLLQKINEIDLPLNHGVYFIEIKNVDETRHLKMIVE